MRRFIILLLAGFFFYSCQNQMLEPVNFDDQLSDQEIVGEKSLKSSSQTIYNADGYLLMGANSVLPEDIESQVKRLNGKIANILPELGIVKVNSSDSNFASKVGKIKGIQYVIPNIVCQCIDPDPQFAMELDPESIGNNEYFFSLQWPLQAIQAPQAWDAGYTGKGVKVFVLDSGIDAEHPDFSTTLNRELSTSFVPMEEVFVREGFFFNHGTHVAGIIGAADGPLSSGNTSGVIGVAPNVELVAVKVLSEFTGSGSISSIINGIYYASINGANVINMSLGMNLPRSGFLTLNENGGIEKVGADVVAAVVNAYQRAITYAYQKGAVVITSAGNDEIDSNHSKNLVIIPAQLNHIVSVSATAPSGLAYNPSTDLDVPAFYTNYGQKLIDVAAPGGDFDYPGDLYFRDMVFSTISNGWGFSAGTSMSSPHVAGVAALVIERLGVSYTPAQVMQIIYNTSDDLGKPGLDAYYGHGRINAYKAVTQ